jgi:selenocysteine lyase/cysteine desulfurase
MIENSAVKAYFNYAGLNWPTGEIAEACRQAEQRFQALRFSLAGLEQYTALMLRAKKSISNLLGLPAERSDGIFLLPNATTGLSLVLRGLISQLGPDRMVVTTEHEHPAVERVLESMEHNRVHVQRVGGASDDEFIEQLVAHCLNPGLAVVVLSQASYKDGRAFPISRVAEILAPRRIPLIVDGNQAIGQIPVALGGLSYAAYIFSGHKWLGAPMGTGAVSLTPGFFPTPMLEMFADLQTGTLSYIALTGLDAACDQAARALPERMMRLAQLKRRILDELRKLPKVTLADWNGPMVPGIAALLLGAETPSLGLTQRLFARHGVAVKAFVPPERPNAIRISWSTATTDAEIEQLIEALKAELA